jgi:hypothetical protein
MVIILIAIGMMMAGIEYPTLALTLWWLYIWIYYGLMTSKNLWKRILQS